jgi:hypothetical protein
MRRAGFILLVFLAGIVLCCKKEVATSEELLQYTLDNGNGLVKKNQTGSIQMQVAVRPTDLLVSQQIEGTQATGEDVLKWRNTYGKYLYFTLSLSHNGNELLTPALQGQFSEILSTLSYRMPTYVCLTTSHGDTLEVVDAVLNRTFGMAQSTDLLFAFNKDKLGDAAWLQFNLNEFGLNTGHQRFRFEISDLANVPELKFN